MFSWIFGILGFITFGPIGMFIGIVIGMLISSGNKTKINYQTYNNRYQSPTGNFDPNFMQGNELPYRVEVIIESLIALGMLVARADKRLFPREKEVIRSFILSAQFGPDAAIDAFVQQAIERYKTEHIDLYFHTRRISPYLNFEHKQVVVLMLVDVARADGRIDNSEIAVVRQICAAFHISDSILDQFLSRQGLSRVEALKVLGLQEGATAEDIKKAYRKLALQFHPDRMAPTVSEAEKKVANEKFIEIQKAYDYLNESGS